MIPTSNNIFDLLLGNLAVPADRPTGVVGQNQDSAAVLFADIINSYLGQAATVDGSGQATGVTVRTTGRTTDREAKLLFEALLQPQTAESTDIEISGETDAIDNNAPVVGKEWLSTWPLQSASLNQNVKNIMTGMPVDITPGTYDVVDSSVVDGRLNLELVSKGNPESTIKISISTELLSRNAEINSRALVNQSRVELDGYAYDKTRFEALLSGTKVREIEIKGVSDTDSPINIKDPLQITLVAESSSGELVLRNKMNRGQLKIEVSADSAENAAEAVSTGGADQAEVILPMDKTVRPSVIRLSHQSQAATSKAAVADESGFWSRQADLSAESEGGSKTVAQPDLNEVSGKPDIFEEFGLPAKKISISKSKDGVEGFFGFDKNVSDKTVSESTPKAVPVRFSLPENIKTALKPNGSSVTINIEPEQLGPAKLSLSFHNDQLRARVTVSSEAARTTVESHVDKLMTQLSKADIKVEFIEVSVSGNGAHNQFLGQQRQWRSGTTFRSLGSDGMGLGTQTPTVTPAPALAAQYVGRGGVNLLA